MTSVHNSVRTKIKRAETGYVFAISDFSDLGKSGNIRQILFRLVKKGELSFITSGIYYKPKYNPFLKEYLPPSIHKVAYAIARNNGWSIAVGPSTAMNILGLSAETSASYEYISDGPNRTYSINGSTLKFLHRSPRDLKGLSPTTSLVIQALKGLGQGNVDEKAIISISQKLSAKEKEILLKEGGTSVHWIQEIIRRIAAN